jgi:hypothetical protein
MPELEADMPENRDRRIIRADGGFIKDIVTYIRLVVRLMGDRRVSPFLKFIPVGSLVYLVFPFDVPGPLDDAAVVGMGFYLFVELCPPDVVEEHVQAIRMVVPGEWQPTPSAEEVIEEADVIEAEYREE